MSKDFASGGLRIGCLWSLNSELQRAIIALAGFHWLGQMDQIVAATLLEDSGFVAEFLETSRSRLARANALARRLLDEAGIPYAAGSNAGFFLWVDLSAWLGDSGGWEGEERLVKRLGEEEVFLTPGKAQGSEEPGWFRLVFSREEVVLKEGIKRLRKCLIHE